MLDIAPRATPFIQLTAGSTYLVYKAWMVENKVCIGFIIFFAFSSFSSSRVEGSMNPSKSPIAVPKLENLSFNPSKNDAIGENIVLIFFPIFLNFVKKKFVSFHAPSVRSSVFAPNRSRMAFHNPIIFFLTGSI